MLQESEIEQRFNLVQQAIGQATQACTPGAPAQLKDAIDKLDRQSGMAKEVLQSHDQARIVQCVDDLEMLGDEAKRVCGTVAGQVPPKLKEAVVAVHEQLSDLKHKLH